MKDMQVQLQLLRVESAKCAVIRDLATDDSKRDLFGRLAAHYEVLASEIERAMLTSTDRYRPKGNSPPPCFQGTTGISSSPGTAADIER